MLIFDESKSIFGSSKPTPAKLPKPSFLMVFVAGGDIAYRRPDGIIVCPLSALKPAVSIE